MTLAQDIGSTQADDAALLAAPLVGRKKPGQWIAAVIVLWIVAEAVYSVATNKRFQWGVVWHFFHRPSILDGLVLTIWLTAASLVVGYAIGLVLAVMRLSSNPVLRSVSFAYVWLVRSIPPLVLLLLFFNLGAIYPQILIGIPYVKTYAHLETAHLFSGLLAAFLALVVDIGAFSSEVIRGGLLSVDPGQTEAARALGIPRSAAFRRIVVPQAMPAIIPASGNMLIGMLKATSVVSVIGVQDLLHRVEMIYAQNFLVMPLLMVATIWYLIITTVLSIGQYFVERHYARGRDRAAGQSRSFGQTFLENVPLFPRLDRKALGA